MDFTLRGAGDAGPGRERKRGLLSLMGRILDGVPTDSVPLDSVPQEGQNYTLPSRDKIAIGDITAEGKCVSLETIDCFTYSWVQKLCG